MILGCRGESEAAKAGQKLTGKHHNSGCSWASRGVREGRERDEVCVLVVFFLTNLHAWLSFYIHK